MSLVRNAKKSEEADLAHINSGVDVQPGVVPYDVTVPAYPLSELLVRHNIAGVDLLSLDVEGYELLALRGLDLESHRPTYILVEANFPDEIENHLSPYYRRIAELSHQDFLYRRK